MSSWASRGWRTVVLALGGSAAALAAAAPAAAKVVFTGYGSFNFDADTNLRIFAPPALLGGTPEGTVRARGFSVDAIGLFAATNVGDDSDFLMDLSYQNVGSTVKTLRIQYAFLDTALPWWDLRLKAGKVTLPIGYYNTRRFYPFQRVELTPPLYQSGILGLPIADVGGELSRHFDLGYCGLDARFYAVNGYGSVPGSSETFRSASLPNGLSISNNLTGTNNSRDVAVGGQLALTRGTGELGASYYRGAWDRSGERLFQMAGTHVHWAPGSWDLLGEYLHLYVQGDEGLAQAFGSPDWTTDGGFVTASHPVFNVAGRTVTGYGRGELYGSGATNGLGGHEVLRSAAGGFSVRTSDWIMWKGEYLWLDYRLPAVSGQAIELMGYIAQLGLVVTF